MKAVLPATLLACAGVTTLRADFSYQQNAKITGGALASVMKFAGAFSKQAREPMDSHIYVKGHRIAHVSQHSAQITDVDKETMTTVDFDHKTYSVMTFAQLKEQFERMSQEMKDKKEGKDVNMNMNVSAKNTGQTKDIDGIAAKELILTMAVEGSDPQTGKTGSMDIRSDMWMGKVDGYDEVRELYKLMGEKLGFVAGGSLIPMQRPDMVKNMGELYREMGKVDGMPIETIVTMGGTGGPPSSPGSAPSSSNGSNESAKSQSASDAAVGAALSRLGGLPGGFGGFGRKKKKAEDEQQQQQQQSTAPAPDASQSSASSGSLIEMTTRASNFSTAAVEESHFAIPEGFKQVESDLNRRR